MNIISKSKSLAIVISLAVAALLFFGVAYSAKALTTEECDSANIALVALGIPQSTVDSILASQCGGEEISGDEATLQASIDEVTTQVHPPYVRLGSRGDNVEVYQRALMALGKDIGVWQDDGIFGPVTEGQFRAFQAEQGIVVDGIIGNETRGSFLAALQNMIDNLISEPEPDPELDTDSDGLPDLTDPDDDNDGIDDGDDNCSLIANADQSDVDGDGIGDLCDDDFVATDFAVSLASDNPASGVVIETQAAADMLHIMFTGDYTVTNVKLARIGISTSATLGNVYLFDGAVRLTDAASVNSQGEITFNQPSGLFTVDGAMNVSVRADIATNTSGQTVGVSFTEAFAGTDAITGSALGNLFSIATAPGTMSVVSFGTVTPTGAIINPGPNVTLWQSQMTLSGNDVFLDRIAFRQVGSAQSSAFANLKLYAGGVEIAQATELDSNGYVTFVPETPVLMQSSKMMRVEADIISGASRTIHLSLRTAADGGFRDSQLGVNVTATGIPAVAAAANTISGTSGGTLTIEKDVSSPTQNVTLNGSDSVLGVYKLTAFGEDIKIETLIIGMLVDDGTVTSLRNGRIMIDSVQYGSTASIILAGTSFTLNYVVVPGSPALLEIRSDVFDNDGTNNMTAGDIITVSIDAGSSNATRMDSLGTFSIPTVAIDANALTVASAAITLTENTTYADQTVVLPQTGFKIGSWNLVGSSVEDVLLSTLSFDVFAVSGANFLEGDLTNMFAVVKSGSDTVASPAPLAVVTAAGNNYSINYTLSKNETVSIELFATLTDDLAPGVIVGGNSFNTDLTVTGTSLESGQAITATPAPQLGQTIIAGTGTFTASLDPSAPVTAIVYDNQTIVSSSVKFAAVNAGYKLTDLTVTIPAAGATVISTVTLKDASSGAVIGSLPGAVTMNFAGLDWDVAANMNGVMNIELTLASIGFSSGTSGASLLTSVTAGLATSAATGVNEAILGSAAGNVHYAYAAVPTITQVALADTTLLNTNARPLIRFTITGNGGDVAWDQLTFKITKDAATTVGTSATAGITLWDVTGGGNNAVAGVFTNEATVFGAGAGPSDVGFVPTLEQVVSGAQPKTYELRGDIGAADASGDFVTTTLDNDQASVVANDTVSTILGNDTDAPIIWSDMSASGHSTTTDDWTTDFGVKNLPVFGSLNWPN